MRCLRLLRSTSPLTVAPAWRFGVAARSQPPVPKAGTADLYAARRAAFAS